MMKTRRRPLAGRFALACLAAPLLAAIAGCGGGENGTVDDSAGTSTTQSMNCTVACKQSDTLASDTLEAHFYVVDDGSRTQAQVGFFSGITIGYNVELRGDVVNFVQGTTTTRMALAKAAPTSNAFFSTLGLPGNPYLADFSTMPTAAVTGEFRMVRATQTLSSSVVLPAPFRITAPGNNATSSKTSDAVTIQLDSAQPNVAWQAGTVCTDTTGTTHVQTASGAAAYFTTADSRNFSFDAARFVAGLQYTDANGGAATIASCTMTLKALVTNDGTLAEGLGTGSAISGIQLRTVVLNLK